VDYKRYFIKNVYDALNGVESNSVEEAITINEHAEHRVVGLTIETRPDVCSREDILEILSIDLLGLIPEDRGVIDASNQGHPVVLDENSEAGQAYRRIAKRLCGEKTPLVEPQTKKIGFVDKLKGMFR